MTNADLERGRNMSPMGVAAPQNNNNQWSNAQYGYGYDNGGQAQVVQYAEDDYSPMINYDIAVRHGFIRKVFSILMIQLAVTFAIIIAMSTSDTVKAYVQGNTTMYYTSVFVVLALVIVLSCCTSVARKHPFGLIFLFILTLAEGYMLGVVASYSDTYLVYISIGATLIVSIGLMLFAWQTKYDFTGWGPYLLVALLVLLVFGLVLIFIEESRTTYLIFAWLGVTLFSMFLVYDTQLIIGGKNRRYELGIDDYVLGALSLYLDIVNIFIYMLAGLSGCDS
mmetsp:Transcript_14988/g.29175  ORF Transcript_14988/g.29175 Transcript_14988/m.29175 type:complete len:280 (-) Transcript_14988:484-1323(-)|eukprot:CAMPEP_0171501836 /NCGR_PEP_ID=MMETSP0958-20121227/9795_1 /TAXON_ID=87120 /ORGANISM="Aurantiochytrium limacinum, Strain ATCCMYA-1381" /LENGTH=279 /DNA_ID=CAMNT_0012036727 /DNA_START=423 /DNA_END=1262 /DNA_ORIENTATION=-